MTNTMNLRYEGSLVEMRGNYVTKWQNCHCDKCLTLPEGSFIMATVEANGQPVRMSHARRSSFVEVAPSTRSIHERCADLVKALGIAA